MDISRIDLNLLLVFHALIEEGSVTAAAKRLKSSQPTVSYSLKKLRNLFNDELFVRHGSGMKPTQLAERLGPTINQVVRLIHDDIMIERSFTPSKTERNFSICLSDIGELVFLPPIVKRLETEAPNAHLRSLSIAHEELYERLADGTADMAIGFFPDLSREDIIQQTLFRHPFTCIARAGNPLIDGDLTMETFLAAGHVVVSEKGRSQEIAEHEMTRMGLKRRVALQTPHFMSAPFIVSNSDLLAIVPRAVGQAYERRLNLQMLKPPFELPVIELNQFWHRRVHRDPAIIWLRNLIAELFLRSDPSSDAASPIFDSHRDL